MNKINRAIIWASLAFIPQTGLPATQVIDLSLLHTDEANSKFGEYNDLQASGSKVTGAFNLSGDTPWSTDRGHWQMEAKNLGLGSYDFSYTLNEPNRYKVKLTFDGSQQYTRTDTRTPFIDNSNNTLGLPANWMAAPTTTGLTALNSGTFSSTLPTFDEEVHRDSIDLELKLVLGKHWQFDGSYQSHQRQGTQLIGAAIFFDASTAFAAIMPTEIDEETLVYRTSLTYSTNRLINTVTYLHSSFDEKNDQLQWVNPFAFSDNPTVSYPSGKASVSLAPDNDRQSLRITGSHQPVSINGLSIAWDTDWTETEQAGNLLPYSVNPALRITEPVPINDIEVQLDSFTGKVRFSYRVPGKWFKRLNLRSSYSIDDRDYDKDRTAFNYIRGDGANQPQSVLGIYANAHDYRKERSLVAADYRMSWWRSKATLAFERTDVERKNAAVTATDTDTVRGVLRIMPMDHFGVRIESAISDRSSSTYQWDQSFLANRTPAFIAQTPLDQRFNNHPLLSQFHLANAETDDLKVRLSYTGFERWSFALDLQQQETDYDKTILGLVDADSSYYGIDVQYLASAQFTGYAMASWASYDANTAGRSFGGGIEKPADRTEAPLPQGSDPGRDWMTRIQDKLFTFSAGLTWQNLARLSAEANYTFVRTESEFQADTGGASDLDARGLPDVDTELVSINLSITYQFNENTGLTAIYQYFDFEESDWATQGVTFDSVSNLLGAGQSSLDGEVNLIGISIQHRF